MSYSIMYDKCFIKVGNDNYIPFILGGDNNVYVGFGKNEKRAREWSNQTYHTNGAFFATKENIMQSIEKERNSLIERYCDNLNGASYNDNSFGWFAALSIGSNATHNTTFSMYKNFYVSGIKNALTIEEYAEQLNIHFKIHCYVWDESKFVSETGLMVKPDVTFETTEQMLTIIDEYKKYYAGNTLIHISIMVSGSDYSINNRKPKRKRTVVEKAELTNNYWTIVYDKDGYYFARTTKYGFKYSYSPFKKFATEKEAIRFHSKMKNKEKFSIKLIN